MMLVEAKFLAVLIAFYVEMVVIETHFGWDLVIG